MKKLFLTFVAAALSLPLIAGDFPQGSPKFEHSLKAVSDAAAKSGKPMVVVFSAVWCGPCQAMKKDVYPSKEVAALHDKFEWAYLDADEDSNAAAMTKFGVSGIPHIQFLDKAGKPIGNQVGSTSPGDFAATLASILKKAGS
jgi:thioredoxin-related protein